METGKIQDGDISFYLKKVVREFLFGVTTSVEYISGKRRKGERSESHKGPSEILSIAFIYLCNKGRNLPQNTNLNGVYSPLYQEDTNIHLSHPD